MIKGRYVVQIVVDFSYDKEPDEKTYKKLQERFASSWVEDVLKYWMTRIFCNGKPQIKVTRQLADIVRSDEDASD